MLLSVLCGCACFCLFLVCCLVVFGFGCDCPVFVGQLDGLLWRWVVGLICFFYGLGWVFMFGCYFRVCCGCISGCEILIL